MLKSNLIDAIRTLSPKEMKEFSEFVSSPFFNKNKNVIKLFELIKKYYPDLESEKLSKENVYSKLFPGEQYKDSSIRLLMFYLYELAEKFLAYERYTRDEFHYKKKLLEELIDRNLLKEFEKTYEEVREKLEGSIARDGDFYMDRFELAHNYYDYLATVHSDKYDKYITKENLESLFNNLTYSYLIRMLKFYSTVLNTQYLLKNEVKTEIFENILKNFDSTHFESVPMVNIYYRVIMLLLKPEEEKHYYTLKKLILENENIIGNETLTDLYINLENYCTRRVRGGDNGFLKESLDIRKLELEKGTYKMNGFMATPFYRSIVNVGCVLQEFDYVNEFIEKYKDELKEDEKSAHYNFCRALLETSTGNSEKALEHLSKVKTDDLYLKMDIRMLQCKLYFDLNWDDTLNSLIESFRRTLANNKLMPEFRKLFYSNFIKYAGKLNNIRHKADELDIDNFKKQVKAEENIFHKAWLIERAEKLEKELNKKTVGA
jgi:hypothetical protein